MRVRRSKNGEGAACADLPTGEFVSGCYADTPDVTACCRTAVSNKFLHPAAYLIACGLIGDPTARVIGSGGPQKKNSYTLSVAQSSARSLR